MRMHIGLILNFILLVLLTLPQGCRQGVDGPKRYDCRGTVTFNGEPVPRGSISFEPDVEAGNSGPGSMAQIENGVYRTELGKGIVGGPYRIFIVGFDGKSPDGLGDGNPLFPEIRLEKSLPHENCEMNFELPQ